MELEPKEVRIGYHSSYFNSSEESGTNNSANNLQDGKGMSKSSRSTKAPSWGGCSLWLVAHKQRGSHEWRLEDILARATTKLISVVRRQCARETSHLDMRRADFSHQEGCC